MTSPRAISRKAPQALLSLVVQRNASAYRFDDLSELFVFPDRGFARAVDRHAARLEAA